MLYYISPQVWAWRRGRVKTIARLVDRMLVLFPFEVDFYREHDVDVVHVGHPLVDEVPVLPQAWDTDEPCRRAVPGGAAARLAEERGRIPAPHPAGGRAAARRRAPHRGADHPARRRSRRRWWTRRSSSPGCRCEIIGEDRFAAIADSHLALCASGTATLEVGLLGTPMIMVYRLASWTYVLAKLLVHLPNVSLVNLVLGRRVVPELIQGDANPRRIAAEAARLLTDAGERGRMRAALAEVRGRLGEGGASRRAAAEVAAMLTAGSDGGDAAEVARN